MRVLVIDDSPAVRAGLTELIGELDFVERIEEAVDGADGMAAASRFRPHVVLLDLRMPRVNGLDVLAALKRSAASPVVIILTSHATASHRERCMAAGATDFLDKTRDFERIPELLRELHARVD